ncbi:MAG TPA: hypothetical protein VF911_14725, partial [Thermoanaerobaculia bacterium]
TFIAAPFWFPAIPLYLRLRRRGTMPELRKDRSGVPPCGRHVAGRMMLSPLKETREEQWRARHFQGTENAALEQWKKRRSPYG